jgi:hypothetical protein
MATHDYVIANGTGSAVRSDINNVLAAIVSANSSSTEPSTKYAYQLWADTNTGYLKIRNAANNAWIQLFKLDATLSDIPIEGTVVKSTGESGGTKFLREDGDNTCSWQTPALGYGFKNLVINGAMQVAQRATQATSTGYNSIDRFAFYHLNVDEAPTYAQVDVASGTTPYELGFRKCLRVMNGNQTSGAGTADNITVDYRFESQDIANSGWDYTSASSYITLSFWVKSSVAQDFKLQLKTEDGTEKAYPMSTGALSANTWTKITKTIPGHADLQFDNNNAKGFNIHWFAFLGTDSTASVTDNAWMNYSGSSKANDCTSTWYTTNDATLDITGVQLEVGDTATDFEHRSYGNELARCQRYYYRDQSNRELNLSRDGGRRTLSVYYPVTLRDAPTVTITTKNDDGGATIGSSDATKFGHKFSQATSNASTGAPNVTDFNVSAEL